MGDNPGYICKTCKYSGDVFIMCDIEKIQCRRNHPHDAFPVMPATSWCWDGEKSTKLIVSE